MVDLIRSVIKNTLRIQFEYTLGFWIKSFFLTMGYFADAIMLVVLFSRFNGLAGWTTYEIAFLYGFNTLTYTITASIFAFCANFSDEIAYGGYDQVLLLPVNTLLFYTLRGINVTYLSRILLSLAIVYIALYQAKLTVTFTLFAYILMTLIGAVLIQSAFFLAFAIPNFYIIKSNSFRAIYMGLRFFCNYPLIIYGKKILYFFTFIIPLGFINYYPALHIFSKPKEFPIFVDFITFPIGFCLFMLSIIGWVISSKYYQSTGC